MLGVWGSSCPKRRGVDTAIPRHGCGLRPGLLLVVGGEKKMPGLVVPENLAWSDTGMYKEPNWEESSRHQG